MKFNVKSISVLCLSVKWAFENKAKSNMDKVIDESGLMNGYCVGF